MSALSAAVGRADNADKADKGLRAICTKRPGDLYNSVGESTLKRSFCLNHRLLTVGFAPDGKRLLTGQADHNIYSWDVENGGQRLGRVGRDSTWVYAAPSPDGGSYASWSSHALKVKLWDLEARAVRHTFTAHRGRITDVTFSPNGATLVTAGVDGAVKIWDIAALLDN